MAYELKGKIKLIQDPQTFASGFTKRELVVTVEDGKYPQEINLEFLQDKVSLLDDLSEGQEVNVSFDIRGHEYNGRYFNNLIGWRVEVIAEESAASTVSSDTEESPPVPDESRVPAESQVSDGPQIPDESQVPADVEEFDDDIPF